MSNKYKDFIYLLYYIYKGEAAPVLIFILVSFDRLKRAQLNKLFVFGIIWDIIAHPGFYYFSFLSI